MVQLTKTKENWLIVTLSVEGNFPVTILKVDLFILRISEVSSTREIV